MKITFVMVKNGIGSISRTARRTVRRTMPTLPSECATTDLALKCLKLSVVSLSDPLHMVPWTL